MEKDSITPDGRGWMPRLHSQEGLERQTMRQLASRMAVMTGEGALSVYARAKELEREGRSIIHLELGEPDFHPSASVNDALKRAVDDGKDRYCAVAGVLPLREAIASYLHDTRNLEVSADNIVIAPGCKIALFMAMMALIDPGDEVLYPDPGFPGYPSHHSRPGWCADTVRTLRA